MVNALAFVYVRVHSATDGCLLTKGSLLFRSNLFYNIGALTFSKKEIKKTKKTTACLGILSVYEVVWMSYNVICNIMNILGKN